MSLTARIVIVATLTSIVLGFVTVFIVVLADEPQATIRHSLLTLDGALDLLFIGVFTSLPISVPAGLAGGAFAARVAARQDSHRGLWSWAGRGAACGAAVGAIGASLLFALPSIATEAFYLLFPTMVLTGGTTGALVGGVVGAYCSRGLRLSGAREG